MRKPTLKAFCELADASEKAILVAADDCDIDGSIIRVIVPFGEFESAGKRKERALCSVGALNRAHVNCT